MPYPKLLPTVCSQHGTPTKRASCQECNRAYMRQYLRVARQKNPVHALWSRAKDRARRLGLTFDLKIEKLTIPERCPALGIALVVGEVRSKNSPSLDRIVPIAGYIDGNVRVLSDQANRLKSNLSEAQLRARSIQASKPARREDYRKLAAYAEREALLKEVRNKAAQGGRAGAEWSKIAGWLERRFAAGEVH